MEQGHHRQPSRQPGCLVVGGNQVQGIVDWEIRMVGSVANKIVMDQLAEGECEVFCVSVVALAGEVFLLSLRLLVSLPARGGHRIS